MDWHCELPESHCHTGYAQRIEDSSQLPCFRHPSSWTKPFFVLPKATCLHSEFLARLRTPATSLSLDAAWLKVEMEAERDLKDLLDTFYIILHTSNSVRSPPWDAHSARIGACPRNLVSSEASSCRKYVTIATVHHCGGVWIQSSHRHGHTRSTMAIPACSMASWHTRSSVSFRLGISSVPPCP